jgi:serine/threonine protein kinase
VIHRDLKPDNMLLTRDWTLKLTDFGEARAQNLGATMTSVGTPIYISPEVMRADHYDTSADTWSYGLCLVAMIRGEKNIRTYSLGEVGRGGRSDVPVAYLGDLAGCRGGSGGLPPTTRRLPASAAEEQQQQQQQEPQKHARSHSPFAFRKLVLTLSIFLRAQRSSFTRYERDQH